MNINNLGLSIRSLVCLQNNGIFITDQIPCKKTLRCLAETPGYQLPSWKNFGMKSYTEVIQALSDNGIEYK